ncbi:MAG: fumarate hydratase [Planctomycetota bacterium]
MSPLETSLVELIRRTATQLANDVWTELHRAYLAEEPSSRSRGVLHVILENLKLAALAQEPMTAHTSSIHFYVRTPTGYDHSLVNDAARTAVIEATKAGYLQSQIVDPVSGKVLKGNVGPGMPIVVFESEPSSELEVRLILKGNGAEGSGSQIALPDAQNAIPNDMVGVRAAILQAIVQIQGRGCGPGVLGVGIGGDRASGMAMAHHQLLRELGDKSSNKQLAQLEEQLLTEANSLGIGPLGLGGKCTLLDVKIGAESTPSESCYVSISYVGWCVRRQGCRISAKGEITTWLYPASDKASKWEPVAEPEKPARKLAKTERTVRTTSRVATSSSRVGRGDDDDDDDDDEDDEDDEGGEYGRKFSFRERESLDESPRFDLGLRDRDMIEETDEHAIEEEDELKPEVEAEVDDDVDGVEEVDTDDLDDADEFVDAEADASEDGVAGTKAGAGKGDAKKDAKVKAKTAEVKASPKPSAKTAPTKTPVAAKPAPASKAAASKAAPSKPAAAKSTGAKPADPKSAREKKSDNAKKPAPPAKAAKSAAPAGKKSK